jgi:uroporphyrinogen-III decarboxylase
MGEFWKETPLNSLERVRNTVLGKPVDRLACQPMLMQFAAYYSGMKFIDYTRDGRKMAEAQLKAARDFDIDVLLTCSDPAREVIDLAGDGSIEWFENQGPAIQEERAALADKARLKELRMPTFDPASRSCAARWARRIQSAAGLKARWRWPRSCAASTA